MKKFFAYLIAAVLAIAFIGLCIAGFAVFLKNHPNDWFFESLFYIGVFAIYMACVFLFGWAMNTIQGYKNQPHDISN